MAAGKYKDWLTKEGLLKIGAWARDGLTKEQIAKNMGISRDTLNTWEKKYPDISDTLKKNREVADIIIENALYEKAKGSRAVVKKPIKLKRTEYNNQGKKIKEEEYVVYGLEEVVTPPDTTAAIFWLKNRKPDVWKDKQVLDADVHMTEKLEDLL